MKRYTSTILPGLPKVWSNFLVQLWSNSYWMELPWRHLFIFKVPIWGFEISIFTAAILVFWNRMQWELVLTVKPHAFSLMAVDPKSLDNERSAYIPHFWNTAWSILFLMIFYLIFILNEMSSWVAKLNASRGQVYKSFSHRLQLQVSLPGGHRWVQVKGMYALASLFRPQKL